jgi:hypothetical protein
MLMPGWRFEKWRSGVRALARVVELARQCGDGLRVQWCSFLGEQWVQVAELGIEDLVAFVDLQRQAHRRGRPAAVPGASRTTADSASPMAWCTAALRPRPCAR